MKVVVIEPAGKGGMIHYSWQLCRAMHELGASVTLLTDRHYELEALEHPFTLKRSLRLWDPKPAQESHSLLVRRLRRVVRAVIHYREWLRIVLILRRLRPDVIQLGDIRFATDLLPIRALRRQAPLLADICHNINPFSGGAGSTGTFEISRFERSFYSRTYQQFDAIFVHYDVNAEEFSRTFPASAESVVRIVHGNERIFHDLASPESTPKRLRDELALHPTQRVVLFFGTLSLYKGLDLLLEAFARVNARTEGAVLVLAGYPTASFDTDAYLEEANRRGLKEHLRIVARYVAAEDVRAWMDLADVAVFPYRSIYQSGALQLAQTFGAPIVATRVGAMPEVIRDGETGLLVEPGQPDALSDAITALLDDDDLARRLGSAARKEAEERFSWSNVARTILKTYEDLMERRRS